MYNKLGNIIRFLPTKKNKLNIFVNFKNFITNLNLFKKFKNKKEKKSSLTVKTFTINPTPKVETPTINEIKDKKNENLDLKFPYNAQLDRMKEIIYKIEYEPQEAKLKEQIISKEHEFNKKKSELNALKCKLDVLNKFKQYSK